MNFQRLAIPVLIVGLLAVAWRSYGWPGIAAVGGGLVMWLLLHVTRLMTVMQRAAKRPIGSVASAVMLNAKLKPGATLFHVIAMTRSIGERLSAEGEQPERYRWTDGSDSSVTASFAGGKLTDWQLSRPASDQ
ncbi:glycerate kinase [Hydrogenophaga sp. RWCD_12]|uniref:glycerate kinase n=1 Tax=Hydrogenophaga sp. RWCD_12 TaxID=3391190 RepID=UPI00398480CF